MEQLLEHDFSELKGLLSKLKWKEAAEEELDILEKEYLEAVQSRIHRFAKVRIGKKHKRTIYEIIPATYYFFPGNKRTAPCFYFVAKKDYSLREFKEDKWRRRVILLSPDFARAILG